MYEQLRKSEAPSGECDYVVSHLTSSLMLHSAHVSRGPLLCWPPNVCRTPLSLPVLLSPFLTFWHVYTV